VDILSVVMLIVFLLGLLFLVLYSSQIEAFIERKLNQAAKYATEVQAFLFTLLGVVITEFGRAIAVWDGGKIVIFVAVMVLIILAVWDIRKRSEIRRHYLGSQFTKNLTTSIKDAVKEALKEDREETGKKKRKNIKVV
jgi:hypothetical protein